MIMRCFFNIFPLAYTDFEGKIKGNFHEKCFIPYDPVSSKDQKYLWDQRLTFFAISDIYSVGPVDSFVPYYIRNRIDWHEKKYFV